MHLLVTGASGFIGRHLLAALRTEGHEVIALRHRRGPPNAQPGVRWIRDLAEMGADDPVDAVVNLAGAPILGPPWTAARRRVLEDSRIGTTHRLVTWLRARARPPAVLVSASAIGYYGTREPGHPALEESAPPRGDQYQSRLCQRWEEAAQGAASEATRVACLRFGIVLGRDGGALPALARPVRLGVGAILGSGRQGTPWIHVEDAVGLLRFALTTPSLHGPVNAVAPGHVTHAQLQRALARALHRPLLLRAPAFVLRGLLGEMAQLLVDGQHVAPARALAAGYVFRYPEIEGALREAL